jgi:hypothetical protein
MKFAVLLAAMLLLAGNAHACDCQSFSEAEIEKQIALSDYAFVGTVKRIDDARSGNAHLNDLQVADIDVKAEDQKAPYFKDSPPLVKMAPARTKLFTVTSNNCKAEFVQGAQRLFVGSVVDGQLRITTCGLHDIPSKAQEP